MELPYATASVPIAREFVRDQLNGWRGDHHVVELLTTELATNAVLHARSPFTVSLAITSTKVRVEVADRNATIPVASGPPALDSVSGRGLFLVATLASRWGADRLPTGKRVWFEVDGAA